MQSATKTKKHWPHSNKDPQSFQKSFVIKTGLFDFYRLVVTVLKKSFERLNVLQFIVFMQV